MISIIIASYNSQNTIKFCLNSLRQQITNEEYEIVVADSSSDNTRSILTNDYPEVKLIELSERTFPGPARNAAVGASSGDIIAFIDTDCIASKQWIDKIAQAHQSGFEIVGGAVLNGTEDSYIGSAEHIIEFSEYSPHQKSKKLSMIPTCNLSLRRKVFEDAGCFQSISTKKLTFKSEDVLLCHNIRRLGYKIHFDPSIRIHHHNRTSLIGYLTNQISLGFSAAIVRKALKTRGSLMVTFFPMIGLIPLIKMTILIIRHLQYNWQETLKLIYHLPMVLLGSCFYSFGFIQGVLNPFNKFSSS
jgi:GT2 family glycosyltransferase